MRVIIDTNIIIDALYARVNNCQRILDLADKNKITPVVSQELEREYSLVAGKVLLNSMKESFANNTLKEKDFDAAQDMLYDLHKNINKLVLKNAERCVVTSHKNISPDFDDNKVINLAIDSNCRVILTKNVADFRCVEQKCILNGEGKQIMIMTPKQFAKYYEEHEKEIEREQEHIKIVSKYQGEFKQAKYFTLEDTKALQDLNTRFNKFMPVKDILNSYKITKLKISAISTQLDKIESMDKLIKDLSKTMDDYELHKKTVDQHDKSLVTKLLRKDGYEDARLKMDRCETYLKSRGVCSRDDLTKQREELNNMLATKPELAKNIQELNNSLSVFSKAIEVINKALTKDMSPAHEPARNMTLDR